MQIKNRMFTLVEFNIQRVVCGLVGEHDDDDERAAWVLFAIIKTSSRNTALNMRNASFFLLMAGRMVWISNEIVCRRVSGTFSSAVGIMYTSERLKMLNKNPFHVRLSPHQIFKANFGSILWLITGKNVVKTDIFNIQKTFAVFFSCNNKIR